MFLNDVEFKAWACKTYNITESRLTQLMIDLMDIDAYAPVAKELIDVTFPAGIRAEQRRKPRPGHW